jgi:hypothetical protein
MTETKPAAANPVSDGLVVRGRPPFAMTPTSLLRNPTVSSHAVRLWSVLASYTYGNHATDRPSRSQLASDVGWKSPRSVDTYLAELQNAGYLTVQQRWRLDGGKARNLYILEWETQGTSSAERVDRPFPLPVGDSVSAAQTHAQDSAHGGAAGLGAVVDNPVGAAQAHAQDSAQGVTMPGTQEQDSAPTHAQNPAHLGEEPTTKKEPPPTVAPMDAPAGAEGCDGPRRSVASTPAPDRSAGVDPLVRTIRGCLPDRLGNQLTSSTLRAKAQALANAGWTQQGLASAVTARGWDGAGAGAVIAWLTGLAAQTRSSAAAPAEDSRTATLRRRADTARARAAAAGANSPARIQARELAARLAGRTG